MTTTRRVSKAAVEEEMELDLDAFLVGSPTTSDEDDDQLLHIPRRIVDEILNDSSSSTSPSTSFNHSFLRPPPHPHHENNTNNNKPSSSSSVSLSTPKYLPDSRFDDDDEALNSIPSHSHSNSKFKFSRMESGGDSFYLGGRSNLLFGGVGVRSTAKPGAALAAAAAASRSIPTPHATALLKSRRETIGALRNVLEDNSTPPQQELIPKPVLLNLRPLLSPMMIVPMVLLFLRLVTSRHHQKKKMFHGMIINLQCRWMGRVRETVTDRRKN